MTQDLRRFFAVLPPGLESAAERELAHWGFKQTSITSRVRGGLELELSLADGLALSRRLKVPTRILLRAADFGCRDFPKFFKKMRGLPWGDWTAENGAVDFEASSRGSRLRIKKRIEQTAREAFAAAMPERAPTSGSTQNVYIRFENDVCEISVDLSGDRLGTRGVRTLVGAAPLRENVAAGLLIELAGEDSARAASDVELFDPMCGTGAFAIEALSLASETRSRGYAFERFPAVAEGRWRESALARDGGPTFARAVSWDVDERSIEAARLNSSALGERTTFQTKNVFTAEPLAANGERWAIVNPPYGKRISVEGSLSEWYGRLANAIERAANPTRVDLLLPAKAPGVAWPRAWRASGKPIALSNGGIPVLFYRFAR